MLNTRRLTTSPSGGLFTGLVLALGLAFSGCASTNHTPSEVKSEQGRAQNLQGFIDFMKRDPDQIWASQVSQKVRQALQAYRRHQRVGPHRFEYGKSVRHLSLAGKTYEELDTSIKQLRCKKKEDVLKNPTTQKPSLDSAGQTIPMFVYLCADGGVFRIKPAGDPTSRFRPEPHASKALRFPFDSRFESFDDEILKIDNQGQPVPKWAKDLNTMAQDSERQKDFISGWADDAHTNLRIK